MNKTEEVHHTKRANNRLKPVADTCIKIFNNPGWLDVEKQLNLLQKRLDRELTPEDIDGEELREAFAAFHYSCVEEGYPTEKQVENVYNAVRRVQSQRWRRLEAKYGPVRHYFDRFGNIKKKYKPKRPEPQVQEVVRAPRGCLIVILLIVAFIVWRIFL